MREFDEEETEPPSVRTNETVVALHVISRAIFFFVMLNCSVRVEGSGYPAVACRRQKMPLIFTHASRALIKNLKCR